MILFLGDGMSVHTIAATRAFMGDTNKQVSFEKFPYLGLSKTYAVNERTPDSANTATAYLTGVKANYGTIGVNAQVQRKDCLAATNSSTHTESIAKWAQDAGKWAGLVTTARVTHASPAGVYAHVADRNWEHDGMITKDKCSNELNTDIARQLLEWPVGRDLRVVLGGGRSYFRDQSLHDEEGILGLRQDGRDLIKEWQQDKQQQAAEAKYVWSRKGLLDVDLSRTDYLLGLFAVSHCTYHGDRIRTHHEYAEPSLSEMTEAAIKLLSRNEQGYFLFVESGRIDMAHHATQAHKAMEETQEFANTIELARKLTSEEDTLIVVTSDHSHTMTINGYPVREITSISIHSLTSCLSFLPAVPSPEHTLPGTQSGAGRETLHHSLVRQWTRLRKHLRCRGSHGSVQRRHHGARVQVPGHSAAQLGDTRRRRCWCLRFGSARAFLRWQLRAEHHTRPDGLRREHWTLCGG